MAAVMLSRDPVADSFEQTEARLTAWGYACRRNSEILGLPTSSGVAAILQHVERQEELRKGVRKKALKALKDARKAWKEGDAPVDAKLVAEGLGQIETELTAKGKQPRVEQVSPQLNGLVAQIDQIVSGLPGWAKKPLYRAYLWGQPSRLAADELKMSLETFEQRRRAGVVKVADKLEERYSGRVNVPSRRRAFRET